MKEHKKIFVIDSMDLKDEIISKNFDLIHNFNSFEKNKEQCLLTADDYSVPYDREQSAIIGGENYTVYLITGFSFDTFDEEQDELKKQDEEHEICENIFDDSIFDFYLTLEPARKSFQVFGLLKSIERKEIYFVNLLDRCYDYDKITYDIFNAKNYHKINH